MYHDDNWATNSYSYHSYHKKDHKGCGYLLFLLVLICVISFFSVALFCVIAVWALKALGIYTIGGWVVAFSWKLVWIATAVITAFRLLIGGTHYHKD